MVIQCTTPHVQYYRTFTSEMIEMDYAPKSID